MDEKTLVKQAVSTLKIDVPIMRTTLEGATLTLYLYGGQVKRYTLPTATPGAAPPPRTDLSKTPKGKKKK